MLQLTFLFFPTAGTVYLSAHPWFQLSAGLHRDRSGWPQPWVAVGGWCLGGLAGRQAFAVQNGLPVIGPGLQPASWGLQLQVLVVAGCEENMLPAGVQLSPCKAR